MAMNKEGIEPFCENGKCKITEFKEVRPPLSSGWTKRTICGDEILDKAAY